MQCPACQHDNRPQAKFCEGCGTRLVSRCSQCATELGPGARFCSECGAAVAASAPPAPAAPEPPPRFTSPEAYTPRHLAEQIISSREALEGERKQVTVLFADLKGSMELLADRDPEEARRILDPVLERMMEAVHRYEGTVNQVMGDGIMALFGAPLAHEDHAVRACYAALRMQESVREYADAVRRAEGLAIHIRVGLNSGEVVVRAIGSDLRMDYTAVGQTTHLAARMEQLAAPGTTLLAPDTLQLAEGYVQVKALGPVQVKGLAAPVEVYELVGAGAARSRLQAAAARGLTKFVGRDAELATLRRTLEQAGAGHGQVVALVGEPGVGKSRLVWEFGHSHRAQGWLVLEAGSVSYGKATSYLPVIDLLKSYCGVEARDEARRVREKLTGKLLTLDPVLEPTLPALLALLDVPVDDPRWQALDPPQRRQRTLDALKRLLLRESQEQPLLLVFEDLHWIDAETQALLDSLVESLPTARLLLLVNYRPEYEHAWHRKTYYQQLRLDPLPAASAEALLDALLGDDTSLRPLRPALVERTEGNPFFLEESVQALVEARVLAGERGAYALSRPFESAQVPATVQAVLAARIDRLAPEDKRLLQAAAVIGKDVPYALLAAIAELPDDALRQSLARLHSAEFLYETSLFPDLAYTFKHALTHEVAYNSPLHDRRRALHGRIVQAMETLYSDRLTEQAERLAHHAYRGEVWEKAAGYLRQAGTRATAHTALAEAIAYFEQALVALSRLPGSRDAQLAALDTRVDLSWALIRHAELQRAMDCLREAETLAEVLDDQPRLADILQTMTRQHWALGEHDRAIESGQRALAIATTLGDSDGQCRASYGVGMAHTARGDYARAINLFTDSLAGMQGYAPLARFELSGNVSMLASSWLAICFAELGEFARGLIPGQDSLRIAEEIHDVWSIAVACWALGHLHLRQGNVHNAITVLERGWQVLQISEIPGQVPNEAGALGYAYTLAGRSGEGLPLLEHAVEQSPSVLRLVYLAEAYSRAGRLDWARDTASRALESAGRHKERGNEAWALRLLGEIAASVDPPDAEQAERHYRQALALADELGMRPLAAHCYLGLGTLYQKIGRDEPARAELTTAAAMYRAMGMPYWLEKAQSALARGA